MESGPINRATSYSTSFKETFRLMDQHQSVLDAKALLAGLYPEKESKLGLKNKTFNMALQGVLKEFKADPKYSEFTKNIPDGAINAETIIALSAAAEKKALSGVSSEQGRPHVPGPAHKPQTAAIQGSVIQSELLGSVATTTSGISPTQPVRNAPWGDIVLLRPGVAVEVPKELGADGPKYVESINRHLAEIEKAPIGQELLAKFDPARNPKYTQIAEERGDSRNLYNGVTVVIRPEGGAKGPIETGAFAGRREDGKQIGVGDHQVPLIFFPLPKEGEQIRHGSGEGEIILTPGGVTKHPDFPQASGKPESYDTILFHELTHSYLKQSKLFDDIKSPVKYGFSGAFMKGTKVGQVGDVAENIEEQFVVGILAGKGLQFSENHYRLQKGYELRGTYKSVNIEQDLELREFPWQKLRESKFTNPIDVLKQNGIEPRPSAWLL